MEMHKIIREWFKVLGKKLDNRDYFLGSSPTTLDAIIYGYLAVQVYADLPNPNLSIILRAEFSQLTAFCDRMRSRLKHIPLNKLPAVHFPTLFAGLFTSRQAWFSQIFGHTIKTEKTKVEKPAAQVDFERKRIISIAGAIFFMTVYVLWNGIIRYVPNEDDGGPKDGVEEEDEYFEK